MVIQLRRLTIATVGNIVLIVAISFQLYFLFLLNILSEQLQLFMRKLFVCIAFDTNPLKSER